MNFKKKVGWSCFLTRSGLVNTVNMPDFRICFQAPLLQTGQEYPNAMFAMFFAGCWEKIDMIHVFPKNTVLFLALFLKNLP